MKRNDGRKNNGAENRGLGEDSQLVRGPRELLEAMRARAAENGQPVATVWRMAATAYLRDTPQSANPSKLNAKKKST